MWLWLVIAALAVLGELVTYDLFLAPVAVAAVIVAVIAPFSPFPLQVGLFGGLSLLGIVFLRPILRHALGLDSRTGDTEAVGHADLVGRRGIVTQTVDADSGQIRIGEGEFWTARSFDPTHTLPPGDVVEVLVIDGIVALVEAVPSLAPARANPSHPAGMKGFES